MIMTFPHAHCHSPTRPSSSGCHLYFGGAIRKTNNMLTFVAFAALAALCGHSDALQMRQACVTPNNSRGTCIEVRDCPPLVELLKAKPLLPSSLEYLRKSQCGFHDKQPLACCPAQNAAPNPAPKPPPGEFVEDVSRHRNLPLLRNDLCGTDSSNRIVNGNRTSLNELPWMTLIAYSGTKGKASPFRCGGTIINDLYILTAGHCVKYLKSGIRPIYVRVGEQDLDSKIDCEEAFGAKTCAPEPQDIPVAQTLAHPQYTGKSDLRNDIALIRLTRQIDFSPDSVRPVCLPIGLAQQDQNLVGKKLTVSGWGVTENYTSSRVLLKVAVPVKSHAECAKVYQNQVQISAVSQLCAGGVRNGGDSCNGDSGGPLTYYGSVEGTPRIIQHGVVSFGPRVCGTTGLPGVYTRVGYYMKWILDNLRP